MDDKTADYTAALVEKEVLQSQVRRLEGENNGLRLENKRIKDKLNKATSRITELERQLFSEQEAHHIQIASLKNELSNASKAQVTALAKQEVLDLGRDFQEKSRIIKSYKTQVNGLKEEIVKVKKLLEKCELDRQSEVDRRKEVAAQVAKLTEVKNLLQQQLLDAGGGTAADKQVRSLESRLRITEDRLCMERADRAAKLSEVEEKLILDNARLQVAEKELKRQLQRERDRFRNLETKNKDLRQENERLSVLLADRPITASSDVAYQNKLQSLRQGLGSKKHTDEIKIVLDLIKKEENLGQGQEQETIWLLWQQRCEISKQLKEYENSLLEIKGDCDTVAEGVKNIKDERKLYEDRITRYKDSLEDLTFEKEKLEQTLSQKVHDLLGEKHSAIAKLRNLEDLHTAIKAESESLQNSLRSAAQRKPANMAANWQVQAEKISSELATVQGQVRQLERQNGVLSAELETLRGQDAAKDQALEEALQELERVQTSHLYGHDPLLARPLAGFSHMHYKEHRSNSPVHLLYMESQNGILQHASPDNANSLGTRPSSVQPSYHSVTGAVISPSVQSADSASVLHSNVQSIDSSPVHSGRSSAGIGSVRSSAGIGSVRSGAGTGSVRSGAGTGSVRSGTEPSGHGSGKSSVGIGSVHSVLSQNGGALFGHQLVTEEGQTLMSPHAPVSGQLGTQSETSDVEAEVKAQETLDETYRSQQLLESQQETETQLRAQLDELQNQLLQKARTLEQVNSAKTENQVALGAVRENLTTANTELSKANSELKMKSIQLEHTEGRVEKMQEDVAHRDKLLSQGIAEAVKRGELGSVLFMEADTPTEVLMEADNRVRNLETQRDHLQHTITQLKESMKQAVQENSSLVGTIRESRQALVEERAQLSQAVADKVDLEQKLQLMEEECKNVQKAKERLSGNLARYETTAQDNVEKLRAEVLRPHVDYEQKYKHLGHEGRMIAVELGTARRIMESREREISSLRAQVAMGQDELSSANRKLAIVREENKRSQGDLEHLTKELTAKLRENVGLQEMNQRLNTDKTKLQLEHYQLKTDATVTKSGFERSFGSLDPAHKLERMEEKMQQAEQALHLKETQLVAAQSDLKQSRKEIATLENERAQLRTQVDKLVDEIHILSSMNLSLETKLVTEKSTLHEEKFTKGHLQDSLSGAARRVELFRREYDIVLANLQAQKETVQTLKEKCQAEEDKCFHLEDKLKSAQLEIQTLHGYLDDTKGTSDQFKKDKHTLYQDLQDLYQKLADKDELITRLQRKCDETVSSIQQDFATEKHYYSKSRETLEENLNKARDEVDALVSKLHTKELELVALSKTQQDLETERKRRSEKDSEVQSLQMELSESKRQVNSLTTEKTTLVEKCKQMQETLEKLKGQHSSVKEQLRTQRDSYTTEIHNLKQNHSEEMHKQEMSMSELKDKLNKSLSSLKAMEVSQQALQETRDSLAASNKTLEKTCESLKTQLHEETTGRKLAEQRIDSLKAQLEDVRDKRSGFDERAAELQAQIARLETELALEQDKYRRLKQERTDLHNNNQATEAHAQALEIQLSEMEDRIMMLDPEQAENGSLRNQIESLKQGIQGKNKKNALELRQQAESFELEKEKLLSQSQQLSVDLDRAREQVAAKNKENLRIQEDLLAVEEKLRDSNSKIRKMQESLKAEEELRMKVDERNQELEILVARLKGRRSSQDDVLSDTSDVSKVMADMSRRMQDHLESQRNADREAKVKDLQKLDEYKKKIAALESALNQEQSLHLVTKTQLQAMEDDNHRLRQQLQAARRRANQQTSEERTKTRMDEINEIIARSQTRAQQMLASGAYGEDPMKMLAASKDFTATGTIPLMRADPDRSFRSDDLNSSRGSDRWSPIGGAKSK